MNHVFICKKKTKTGKDYIMLYVDLVYKQLAISFDDNTIAEVCNLKVSDLYALELDVSKHIANIEVF